MGMIVRKGNLYGGGGSGDNSVEISYEDYQKLSDEEKMNNITYFIPDYPEEDDAVINNIASFIDTSRIIKQGAFVPVDTLEEITVEEDCYIVATLFSTQKSEKLSGYITIDSVIVAKPNTSLPSNNYIGTVVTLPIKKGQTVGIYSNVDHMSYYTLYGMVYSEHSGGTDNTVEVIDNLESTDTDKALSANMGRELNDNLSKKFDKTGGTLSGDTYVVKSESSTDETARFGVVTSKKEIRVVSEGENGNGGLYDSTNSKYLIYSDADGKVYLDNYTAVDDLVSKNKFQSGTVICSYINPTTLYGRLEHTLGDQYNCITTPTYVGENPLEDFDILSVVTVRHNNIVEFYVKGNGFTSDSGIYVDLLLIGL